MKKYVSIPLLLLVIGTSLSIQTDLENGEVVNIGSNEILTEFGMVVGNITFRLGPYRWPAKEVWLVPLGAKIDDFKSTGNYLELPENITFSTCKTSVYNSTSGFAFKSLSDIDENGKFCILAYGGVYEILALY